ncbi:hypothetical protein ACFXAF_24185 [Kitasatospora sp. NPDC059463]|uniref:hypothetical protein n=1 Tax=unclassified Kitasatospora TaxID=2633591 RepID=UPI0036959BCD
MVGAIVYFLTLGLPVVVLIAAAVLAGRKARRAGRLRRAVGDFGKRPGWWEHDRRKPRWTGHLTHYGWLTEETLAVYAVSGMLGKRRATIALLMRNRSRDVDIWLAVCIGLAAPARTVRLERPWSSLPLGVHWPPDFVYVPRGEGAGDLVAFLVDTDIARRLAAVDAPAVSFHDREVCFLWDELPEPGQLEPFVDALVAAVPALEAAAAR